MWQRIVDWPSIKIVILLRLISSPHWAMSSKNHKKTSITGRPGISPLTSVGLPQPLCFQPLCDRGWHIICSGNRCFSRSHCSIPDTQLQTSYLLMITCSFRLSSLSCQMRGMCYCRTEAQMVPHSDWQTISTSSWSTFSVLHVWSQEQGKGQERENLPLATRISCFSFDILHCLGSCNIIAGMLSWAPCEINCCWYVYCLGTLWHICSCWQWERWTVSPQLSVTLVWVECGT